MVSRILASAFLSLGVVSTLVTSAGAQENNQPPKGFTALFNGKDLTGWHGMKHFSPYKLAEMKEDARKAFLDGQTAEAKMHWSVDNGELVNDGKGPYMTTDGEYGDYELWIDYKTVPRADSGIYLKASPQVQIWDYTKEAGKWGIGADKGSGGLWNNAPGSAGKDPAVLADKPFGEWNRFHIIQAGARTTIFLNDKKVVDNALMHNYWNRQLPLPAKGPIQLQTHGGEIRWRNIFIRELSPAEAIKKLRGDDPQGFKSVFNGKDLTGWAGPVDNYEVVDGAIVCKKGKGGTLFTKDTYADHVIRLEFKTPEGGNNGLAIRYPGKGNPAYQGMTELQVLDSEHPKYARLDKRQYHGSAYGMAAAERGYLRDAGEWNYQEVTVKGSTIKVELNGNVILNTDLSKAKDFMANSPHPGKDLKSGHFGFAGHNDAVMFRNISIKTLEPASEATAVETETK